MRKTLVTCSNCKQQFEAYGRVDRRTYKCLACLQAEYVIRKPDDTVDPAKTKD